MCQSSAPPECPVAPAATQQQATQVVHRIMDQVMSVQDAGTTKPLLPALIEQRDYSSLCCQNPQQRTNLLS